MAKDPAFLFYPGDYLRDTQTLSEKTQVSYDRIMCEHMRNICISKQQLKFFTKRLNDDEIEELMYVLTETEDGFQITWVAESISKRKAYSESRRKNRTNKNKKDIINISKTYVKHMENENENENINNIDIKNNKTPHTLDLDFIQEPIPRKHYLVFSAAELKQELLNSYEQKEKIMKVTKLSEEEVNNYITEFVDEQDAKEDLERPLKEIRSHLVSWVNIKLKEKKRDEKFNSKAQQRDGNRASRVKILEDIERGKD